LAFASPADALGVDFGGISSQDTILRSKNVRTHHNKLFLTEKSYATDI